MRAKTPTANRIAFERAQVSFVREQTNSAQRINSIACERAPVELIDANAPRGQPRAPQREIGDVISAQMRRRHGEHAAAVRRENNVGGAGNGTISGIGTDIFGNGTGADTGIVVGGGRPDACGHIAFSSS